MARCRVCGAVAGTNVAGVSGYCLEHIPMGPLPFVEAVCPSCGSGRAVVWYDEHRLNCCACSHVWRRMPVAVVGTNAYDVGPAAADMSVGWLLGGET